MGRHKEYLAHGPLILEMYVEREMSIQRIAEVTGISNRTIGRILNEKGVQMRPRGNVKGSTKKRKRG